MLKLLSELPAKEKDKDPSKREEWYSTEMLVENNIKLLTLESYRAEMAKNKAERKKKDEDKKKVREKKKAKGICFEF